MKRNLKILTILSLVAVLLAFAGCGAGKTANKESAKNYTLPEAVADVRDQAMDYVQDYAKKLEGGCNRQTGNAYLAKSRRSHNEFFRIHCLERNSDRLYE